MFNFNIIGILYNMKNLQIFILLGLISFLSEQSYNECKNKTLLTYIISLLHNYGSMYLNYGSIILGYYKLHLIILITTLLGWYINNGRCILSDYYNKICGINGNPPLRDINYRIFNGIDNHHYIIIGIVIIYDIYHIYYS